MQRAAAAETGFVIQIDDHLDLRQACRQITEIALTTFARGFVGSRLLCPRLPCHRIDHGVSSGIPGALGLLEILNGQRQLIGIELFGTAAEPVTIEFGDQQVQFVDLGTQAGNLDL